MAYFAFFPTSEEFFSSTSPAYSKFCARFESALHLLSHFIPIFRISPSSFFSFSLPRRCSWWRFPLATTKWWRLLATKTAGIPPMMLTFYHRKLTSERAKGAIILGWTDNLVIHFLEFQNFSLLGRPMSHHVLVVEHVRSFSTVGMYIAGSLLTSMTTSVT